MCILAGVVMLSGCTLSFGGSSAGPDGGIFKSASKGASWQSKSLIASVSGRPGSMTGLNTNAMAMDPSDHKALYYAPAENGLFYSYDGAESWQQVPALREVNISAIAVDPNSKCVIYAASQNRLLKTNDCARTWEQTYYDNQPEVTVSALAIDHYDSSIVYIGTSRGEILQSGDGGKSWNVSNRFEDQVKKIAISPADSRILFVATNRKGLFRSVDRGATWVSLADVMKDYPDSGQFRDLYLSRAEPGLMILATNYGLLKSNNNGDGWVALKLLTPEKEAVINSVIISEAKTSEIYYVTNTTFYGTADDGENWATKKLPSNRAGKLLLGDPQEATTLYLGVKALK